MPSQATMSQETVSSFLREHRGQILHEWEGLVAAEARRVEVAGVALRDTTPVFLDELADWLQTGAPPGSRTLGASSLKHVLHRLDQGFDLGQVLDEYRLLREAILSSVLQAEQQEQGRAGPRGENERKVRVVELARLNAGLDVAISDAVGEFVAERDRRAAVERDRARAVLAETEERLRSFLTASAEAVYRMSPDWAEIRYLSGKEFVPDTRPSRSWLDKYIHPDDHARVLAAIDEAIRTRSPFDLEHRILSVDGMVGWTHRRAVPRFDEHGEILEWVGTASDITERKRAEQALHETELRLRATLAERETLLREVHHRVKNNLEVIDSLLQLQAQAVPNPQVRAALSDASNRVHAIAQVHRLLYGSPDLSTLTVNAFAAEVAQSLLDIFGVEPSRVRVTVEGASLQLDLRRAVPVGLILNELVANSLKHAFPDGRSGAVVVALGSDGSQLTLSVRDDGVGMPDRAREGSLGLRLVHVLAEQLKGSVEVEAGSGATVVTVRFPALAPP